MFVRILFVLLITKIFPLFSCELTNGFYKYKDSNYIATPPSSINHEDYDVILIGETHNNQLHHHFQYFLLSNFIVNNKLSPFFSNHDSRCIRISRSYTRHYRRVNYAQVFYTMNLEPVIHYR